MHFYFTQWSLKRFKMTALHFYFSLIFSRMKGDAFNLNKFAFALSMDSGQVLLKSNEEFLKRWKCEKISRQIERRTKQPNGLMDEGRTESNQLSSFGTSSQLSWTTDYLLIVVIFVSKYFLIIEQWI